MTESLAVLSTSAVPTSVDDRLRIKTWNSEAGTANLSVRIRAAREDGTISEAVHTFQTTNNTSGVERLFIIGKGQLLDVNVSDADNDNPAGRIWVSISLQSGAVGSSARILELAGGYVSAYNPVTYPVATPGGISTTGGAYLEDFLVGPAAGAEFSANFTTRQMLDVRGARMSFTTDANVANRVPVFHFFSNASLHYYVRCRTNLVASTTYRLIFWRGDNMPADSTPYIYIPVPDSWYGLYLGLTTITASIQAGDLYGDLFISGKYTIFPIL